MRSHAVFLSQISCQSIFLTQFQSTLQQERQQAVNLSVKTFRADQAKMYNALRKYYISEYLGQQREGLGKNEMSLDWVLDCAIEVFPLKKMVPLKDVRKWNGHIFMSITSEKIKERKVPK